MVVLKQRCPSQSFHESSVVQKLIMIKMILLYKLCIICFWLISKVLMFSFRLPCPIFVHVSTKFLTWWCWIIFYRFWIRLLLDIYMDIIITTKFLVVVVSIIIIFALKVRESLLRCRKKRFSSIGWRWRFGIFDVSSSSWKRFVSSYVLKFLLSNNLRFNSIPLFFINMSTLMKRSSMAKNNTAHD